MKVDNIIVIILTTEIYCSRAEIPREVAGRCDALQHLLCLCQSISEVEKQEKTAKFSPFTAMYTFLNNVKYMYLIEAL